VSRRGAPHSMAPWWRCCCGRCSPRCWPCLAGSTGGGSSGDETPLYAIFSWLKLAEYFLLYMVVTDSVRAPRDLRLVTWTLVAVGVGASVYPHTPTGRAQAAAMMTFKAVTPYDAEPNTLGTFLVLTVGVAAALYDGADKQRTAPGLLCVMGLFLYTTATTYSRGAYGTVGVALLVVALFGGRRVRRFTFLMVPVALYVMLPSLPEFMKEHAVGGLAALPKSKVYDRSWAGRQKQWAERMAEWRQHPVEGVGMGVKLMRSIDNDFVRALYETGIVGLGLLLWLHWRVMKMLLHAHRSLAAWEQQVSLGVLAGYLGVVVHGVSGCPFMIIRVAEPLWARVGAVAGMVALRQEEARAVLAGEAPALQVSEPADSRVGPRTHGADLLPRPACNT